MCIAFALLLPLGALCAHMMRMKHLDAKYPGITKTLFYSHIFCQVSGVLVSTAGLIYVWKTAEDLEYNQIDFHHGQFGLAAMAIVYFQFLGGMCRPPAQPQNTIRKTWEILHTVLGRWAIGLTIINIATGIAIFYNEQEFEPKTWIALVGASLLGIGAIQSIVDRREKQFHQSIAAGMHANEVEIGKI